MLATRSKGNVEIWDTRTARLINSMTVNDTTTSNLGSGENGPLRFVHGGRGLLAVGFASAVVFDVRNGATLQHLRGLTVAWAGSRVIVLDAVRIKFLDAERGTILTLPIDMNLAISPDGSRVAGTKTVLDSSLRPVEVFETETGAKVATIRTETEPYGVAFSADGSRLAIGSKSRGVAVYDVATATVLGRDSSFRDVPFSLDGTRVSGASKSAAEPPRTLASHGDMELRAVVTPVAPGSSLRRTTALRLRRGTEEHELGGARTTGVTIASPTFGQRLLLNSFPAGRRFFVFEPRSGQTLFEGVEEPLVSPAADWIWSWSQKAVRVLGASVSTAADNVKLEHFAAEAVLAIGPSASWILTPAGIQRRKEGVLELIPGPNVADHLVDPWVKEGAASTDGARVVFVVGQARVIGAEKTLIVWDGSSGKVTEVVGPKSRLTSAQHQMLRFPDVIVEPSGAIVVASDCDDPTASTYVSEHGVQLRFVCAKEHAVALDPSSARVAVVGPHPKAGIAAIRIFNGAKVELEIPFVARGIGQSVTWLADKDFIAASDDGHLSLWDLRTKKVVAELVFLSDDRWIAFDSDGRFDTNALESVGEVSMTGPNEPLSLVPLDSMIREYYQPGLIARVLARAPIPSVPDLETLNFITPDVEILEIEQGADGQAMVRVRVHEVEGTSYDGTTHLAHPHDVRLFRDGRLVGRQPAELGGSADIVFEGVALPSGGGEVKFSCYAFNDANVKSETSAKTFTAAALTTTPPKPRAYLINVGIDAYQDATLQLDFAVDDAKALSNSLGRALASQYEVHAVQLLGVSAADQAGTSEALVSVLRKLSGIPGGAGFPPAGSSAMDRARPEDIVILTFSGHGITSSNGRFNLLFGNYDGRDPDNPSTPGVIDDLAIAREIAGVDACEIVVIIDACQSAAAIDAGDFKPGPLGARGFGQMAYDKRIRVLAGTQANDVALEASQVGHGLLTYALVVEGLDQGKADFQPRDGSLSISEWLAFGAIRVPALADALESGEALSRGIKRTRLGRTRRIAQQPRLFDDSRVPSTVKLAIIER